MYNPSVDERIYKRSFVSVGKTDKVLSTKRCYAESGSGKNHNEMSVRPQLDSDQMFVRRIKIPVAKKLDHPSGREICKKNLLNFYFDYQ